MSAIIKAIAMTIRHVVGDPEQEADSIREACMHAKCEYDGLCAAARELDAKIERLTHGSEALAAAIRAFTVDMPNGQPNGERERQLDLLGRALERGDVRAARKAYSLMCGAGANDLKALRVAAEEHFGGDFRAVPS